MEVRVKRLHRDAQLPAYQTPGSAGFDLRALEGGSISPGQTRLVRTGLAIEVPPGYVLLLFPRSGLATKHGITLANAVGVVDSDYRGEILLALHMAETDASSGAEFRWQPGDRLAQGVIVPCIQVQFVEADSLNATERGSGGFGSTGVG